MREKKITKALFVPEIDWLLVLLINRLKTYWTLDWATSIHADLYPTKNFSIPLVINHPECEDLVVTYKNQTTVVLFQLEVQVCLALHCH